MFSELTWLAAFGTETTLPRTVPARTKISHPPAEVLFWLAHSVFGPRADNIALLLAAKIDSCKEEVTAAIAQELEGLSLTDVPNSTQHAAELYSGSSPSTTLQWPQQQQWGSELEATAAAAAAAGPIESSHPATYLESL